MIRRGKKGQKGRTSTPSLRVNKRIRAREVRVIDAEGRQLGIMPPELALQKAMDVQLDLVEVSPEATPPVCRIMDYGKFKYAQKKKNAEAKKNQASQIIKEVKFRPKIEAHDFNFKVDRIRTFLHEGHKAKVTMMFRGREITHQDRARDIMTRIAEELKESGTVESFPRLEGRNMIMVVAPSGKALQGPKPAAPSAPAAGAAPKTPVVAAAPAAVASGPSQSPPAE